MAAYAGVGNGKVPTNGVLNRLHWSLVETRVAPAGAGDPAPKALFAAESDENTHAVWPHRFQAFYMVSFPLLQCLNTTPHSALPCNENDTV